MEYKCTKCDEPTPREDLTVKKIVFLGMGERADVVRTRTADWLCLKCCCQDKEYNIPRGDAPGRRSFNR